MVAVQILKNGALVRQFSCPEKMMQKYFDLAMDIAGGLYNGIDSFTVQIVEP
jgi:hypothetical protein